MAGADSNCRNDLFRQKLIFTRLPVEEKSALALAEHIQNPVFASTPPNRQNIKNFDSEGPDPLKSNFQWTCRFSSCRLKDKNKYSFPCDSYCSLPAVLACEHSMSELAGLGQQVGKCLASS